MSRVKLAKAGVPARELRETMQATAGADVKWKERLANGVSYPASDDVLQVAQEAYLAFFSANALYPGIFPSAAPCVPLPQPGGPNRTMY